MIVVTPSASHLITCSRSLLVKIYELRRLENESSTIDVLLKHSFKPHATPVVTIAIDESGTLLATGAADGSIKVWDIRAGYATHTFRGQNGVVSALLFFHASPRESQKTDKATKRKRSKQDLEREYTTRSSQDSTATLRLASGDEGGKIRIWNLHKRHAVATLDSHVSVVRGFDYSPETESLISASRDKTVIIWDAVEWTSKRIIPVFEIVEAVGFLSGGDFLYTGGERGCVRLWKTATGSEATMEQESGREANGIVSAMHNKKGQFILTINASQVIILRSVSDIPKTTPSSKLISPLPIIRSISGTHDEVIDLAYVTLNRKFLALASSSEDVRIVSLSSSQAEPIPGKPPDYFGADVASLQGHSDVVICLTVDPTGCWLATGAKDNTARLWRIDQPSSRYEHYSTFTGHAESIGAIGLSSTAHVSPERDPLSHPPAFLITGSQDRTVKRWAIPKTAQSTSKAVYTRKAHDKDINAIALSPTGQLFASASQDRTIKIWSSEEGEAQGVLRGHKRGVWSVGFAPKDTPPIPGEDGSSTSASRGLLLSSSGDKTLKIWNLGDYSCIRTMDGHTNSVLKVVWLPPPDLPANPDGEDQPARSKQNQQSSVASAGSDGLVKIWSIVSGECLATLDNHTDRIWALAFNPATRTLVSGGGDSVVTFWKDTSRETVAKRGQDQVERVEQDQELRNCEHEGRWREGIVLALQLNHPARLLGIFKRVVDTSPPEQGSLSGVVAVDEVLSSLADEQLLSLLLRVRDWNTNARTAPVAQRILNVIVRRYSPERLAKLGKRKGGKEVVEALRAYTERHYRRMEELWGESWIVEFLLGEMDQLNVQQGLNGSLESREQDIIRV